MNKAVFLDRDGVINIDSGYIKDIKHFQFKEEIFPLLEFLMNKGFLLIIVSNQSGVSRGFFTKEALYKIHRHMMERFKKEKIRIDAVYYCFSCNQKNYFRKPNPGMLVKAKEKYNIDMKRSILIGDKKSDIVAGKRAGVGCTVLLQENEISDYCISNLKGIKRLIANA